MLRYTIQTLILLNVILILSKKTHFQSCQICFVTDLAERAFATYSFDLRGC